MKPDRDVYYLGHDVVEDDTHSHEIAVLKGVASEWDICYDTPVTDDVIRCGNTAEIDEVMRKIQELDDDV